MRSTELPQTGFVTLPTAARHLGMAPHVLAEAARTGAVRVQVIEVRGRRLANAADVLRVAAGSDPR